MRRTTLAFALLATAVFGSASRADDVQEAATAAAETAASLALNPLAALDKSSLDGFRDLPLFTPSRTRPVPPPAPVAEAPPPPEPEPEPAPEPPAEPPTLTLAGIAEGPEGAVAFVAKEGEEVEQVHLGDDLDGWLVTSIEGESLKLTLDDREQEYRLFVRPEADQAKSGDDEDSSDNDPDQPRPADRDEQEEAQRQQRRAQRLQRPPAQQPQKIQRPQRDPGFNALRQRQQQQQQDQ